MQRIIKKDKWRTVCFGDVVLHIKDRVVRDQTDLKYYLGGEHFDNGKLHIQQKGIISENPIGPAFHMRFKPGHMLIVSRNPHLRKAAIVNFEGICANTTYVCEAVKSELIPSLLPFVMQSDAFWYSAEVNKRGSTNPYLNWGDFARFQFKLPSIKEQESLSDLLWSIDHTVERYSQVSSCLDRLKQSLELGFFKKDNLWKILKIEDVAQVDYGISEAVADNKDSAIGWPILTGANISLNGEIDLFKKVYIKPPKSEQYFLHKGDLLFNWRSGSPAHVGKTALFELEGNYTYASFILRIRANRELFMPEYGFYLFNFLRRTEYFTKDVAQQVNFKMNANVFRSVEIPVPSLKDQENIVSKLNIIVKQKNIVDEFINNTNKIKKQIINQIFG